MVWRHRYHSKRVFKVTLDDDIAAPRGYHQLEELEALGVSQSAILPGNAVVDGHVAHARWV